MIEFSDQWLKSKGCSTFELIVDESEGMINGMKIKQGFASYSDEVYRSQRINIGLIYED